MCFVMASLCCVVVPGRFVLLRFNNGLASSSFVCWTAGVGGNCDEGGNVMFLVASSAATILVILLLAALVFGEERYCLVSKRCKSGPACLRDGIWGKHSLIKS